MSDTEEIIIDSKESESAKRGFLAMFQHSDFSASSLPLFYVLKALGLHSMEASNNGKRVIFQPSLRGSVYSLSIAAALVAASIQHSIFLLDTDEYKALTFYRKFIEYLHFWIQMIVVVAAIVLCQRQTEIIACVEHLHRIDLTLARLGVAIPHKTNRRYVVTAVVAVVAVFACVIPLRAVYQPVSDMSYPHVIALVARYVPWVMHAVYIGYVMAVCEAVRQRLYFLNEHLMEGRRYMDVGQLQAAARIHASMCGLAKEFSATVAIPLLVNCILSFFYILTYLCDALSQIKHKAAVSVILMPIFMAVWYSILMLLVSASCHHAVDESKRIVLTLHKVWAELGTDAVSEYVKQEVLCFVMQLEHVKMSFSAAGFFNINLDLSYSMVGVLTTYIFIVIQFDTDTIKKN